MIITRKWKKATSMALIILLFVGLISCPGIALAAPDTTIDINSASHFTAPLKYSSSTPAGIGQSTLSASWFPGLAKQGTLRITNSYFYKVKINSIALQVNPTDPSKYDLIVDNMRLKINKKGDPVPIYDGGFRGILTGKNVAIEVDRLSSVDFEYTVSMDQNAGNNTQNLGGTFALLFNTAEIPAPVSSSDSGAYVGFYIADMKPDHWAYACTQNLLMKAIIDLEKDNKIRPGDPINRAEVAVMLAKALNIKPVDKLFSGYLDPLPDWARNYIIAISEQGIMHGYPGFLFKPKNNITREEFACVLVRGYKAKLNGDFELDFKDKGDISPWALYDVKIAVQNKLMSGYTNSKNEKHFKPKSYLTRAEAFSIMCRILKCDDKK